RLQQKKLFAVSTADFVVASSITLILILAGAGPMALAISRLAAQAVAAVLMYVFAEVRPRFGFKLDEARPALRFGIPVAAANLLSWTLLNIDNFVIARTLGAAALGFYVLAFNVSTWPMTIIGQAMRSVSLAAFSHVTRIKSGRSESQRDPSLSVGAAISWGAAVPAGVLLAALSNPIVEFLYGGKWIGAAPVLAALGYFGI
ncbi:oligosaccharide flippase family protein, partial [Streptomyces sp. SID10244]|nr:oligosaccharide flippase family protein [Streptomyces sp. SID10244]